MSSEPEDIPKKKYYHVSPLIIQNEPYLSIRIIMLVKFNAQGCDINIKYLMHMCRDSMYAI